MREPGYYWVKYKDEWYPAEWLGNVEFWMVLGWNGVYLDSQLQQIGSRIYPPGVTVTSGGN